VALEGELDAFIVDNDVEGLYSIPLLIDDSDSMIK
jgi:hypothetical protein